MTNVIHQPIGAKVDPLPSRLLPDRRILRGRYVDLIPLNDETHGDDLWATFDGKHDDLWTYLFSGPFENKAEFRQWIKGQAAQQDAWFYAYVPKATGKAAGVGSFMRADPAHGGIEIGSIWFGPALQRTREATEAIFLMMVHGFDDLKVRRFEWKCNDLNAPSRRAALRFGFTFEGIFRQHMVAKGLNRDTAWYSIIDKEWPRIRAGFEAWLQPSNFNGRGQEKSKLKVQA